MDIDRSRRDAGFTLIETIVALVILSAVMIVFFNFLSGAINSAEHIEDASIAYDRRTNALEIAAAINPMEMGSGVLNLGSYRVQWISREVGRERHSTGYPGGVGPFKIALYRMTFSFPDDHSIQPIEVTRLGYHTDSVPLFPSGDNQGTGAGSGG